MSHTEDEARATKSGAPTAGSVQVRVEQLVIPTYLPAAPDKNPMFLEKRVYQGSSGRVYPLPFTDRIAEKPVELLAALLAICPKGGSVLDPFMGSGTTLRAAMDLDLRATGIEIERSYCDVAVQRLSQDSLTPMGLL